MSANLYVQIVGDQLVDLIMPDEQTHTLPEAPTAPGWCGVQWPVPPHCTGEPMIRKMICDRLPLIPVGTP